MKRWRAGLIIVGAWVCAVSNAAAQTDVPRFEAGVQASVLRLSDFGSTSTGIGGRITFNVSRWAALEAEGSFFPQDDVPLPEATIADFRVTYHRKRTDVFFGAKLGYRGEWFGLFAKVRPGFTVLSQRRGPDMCDGTLCPLVLLARPEYRTELAVDLGGVLEFYPSRRVVARFELGDAIIRHRSFAPPCWSEGCTSNNVSSKFGVGLRF